jgi:hypothetical protein
LERTTTKPPRRRFLHLAAGAAVLPRDGCSSLRSRRASVADDAYRRSDNRRSLEQRTLHRQKWAGTSQSCDRHFFRSLCDFTAARGRAAGWTDASRAQQPRLQVVPNGGRGRTPFCSVTDVVLIRSVLKTRGPAIARRSCRPSRRLGCDALPASRVCDFRIVGCAMSEMSPLTPNRTRPQT